MPQPTRRHPNHVNRDPGQARRGLLPGLLAVTALWGPPVCWMAVIFWLSSQPDPGALSPVRFAAEDPVAHLMLYLILGSLLWRATRSASQRRLEVCPACWALGIGCAYGLFDELHQALVPTRTPQLQDVVVDWVGTAVGIVVASAVLSRISARR